MCAAADGRASGGAMKLDYDFLIATNDPLIKIQSDLSELVIDLRPIQPKLHKRSTAKIRQKQATYIMGETAKLFCP